MDNKQEKQKKNQTTIIGKLIKLPFDKDEAVRISASFDRDGRFIKIIADYCPKAAKFFGEYEKRRPIKGFRQGSTAHHEKACQQLARYLREPAHKDFTANWNLYRFGVIEYFRDIHPKFFAVLNENIPEGNEADTEEIARSFAKLIVLRNIDSETFEQFIDLFGLRNCPSMMQALQQLGSVSDGILIKLVQELAAKVENQSSNTSEKFKDPEPSVMKRIESIEDELRTLKENLTQSSKSIENPLHPESCGQEPAPAQSSDSDALRVEFTSKLEDLNLHINSALHAAEDNIKSQLSGIHVALKGTAKHLEANAEDIKNLSAQNDQLLALVQSEKTLPSQSASQLIKKFRKLKAPSKSTSIASGRQFAAYYSAYLDKNYELRIDVAQALIYHTIFLEIPVVLLDDYTLFDAWINTLGWSENVLTMTASPTWLSDIDWQVGSKTLLDTDDTPRFIVLHNFDIALVKCYLLPLLHQRALLDRNASSMAKIILVPSECGVLKEYPDILQYGAGIEIGDYLRINRGERRLETFVDESRFASQRTTGTFATIEMLNKWRVGVSGFESLDEIWRASPLEIPEIQKRIATRLFSALKKVLTPSDAILASLFHTTRLWCKARHDEPTAEQFFELAQIEAGNKVRY